MSREVMQQALLALYENTKYSMRGDPIEYQDQRNDDTIEAIKEALAQPAREPVAWYTEDHLTDRSATTYSKDMGYRWQSKGWPVTPLYTSPPQRQPLTHEQRLDLLIEFAPSKSSWNAESILIDMVEAKHGIGDKT